MKYFAFYDDSNEVRQVLPVPDLADELDFAERLGMACKETFKDGSVRGIFAGSGCVYIPDSDIFIEPKPYPNWVLSTEKLEWIPPVAMPSDGQAYLWDQSKGAWQLISSDLSDEDVKIIQSVDSPESYDDALTKLSPEGRALLENNDL